MGGFLLNGALFRPVGNEYPFYFTCVETEQPLPVWKLLCVHAYKRHRKTKLFVTFKPEFLGLFLQVGKDEHLGGSNVMLGCDCDFPLSPSFRQAHHLMDLVTAQHKFFDL